MKVLIIRFSSIGDIVLTTPVVRCLKQLLDNVEIHYLTKPNFKNILLSNPYIDQVQTLDKDLKETIYKLKKENYDQVIDLHNNLRTLRIKRKLKVRNTYSFDKLNIQKWLLTTFKIDKMPKIHIVDRYLNTVSHLNVQNDGAGLDYFIPEKDIVDRQLFPLNFPYSYIGLVIGASYETKKLPLHKLIELCKTLPFPVVLLGGKEDTEMGEKIAAIDPDRIWNTCGKFNLNQSASLVKSATYIISHDTGLMHIAAAFKKKIISIWGNTVPEFGMYPYYGKVEIENFEMQVTDLSCRPCSKIGYHSCPKKHFKCMEEQDIELIASKVKM